MPRAKKCRYLRHMPGVIANLVKSVIKAYIGGNFNSISYFSEQKPR